MTVPRRGRRDGAGLEGAGREAAGLGGGLDLDAAALDRTLEAAVARGAVPGVVAGITSRRGLVYRRACGTGGGTSLRFDTAFRVASMTKLVTTVAVLRLFEQGRFGLDDPFAEHVPDFRQPGVLESFDAATGAYTVREAARAITVRDLLAHVAGFGYWFLERELLAANAVDYSTAPFLMHDPGARFTYGIGTDVLGRIVEPASGVPLGRFVAESVAAPLGMRATAWDPPGDPDSLAALSKRGENGLVAVPKESEGEPPFGGHGLYSTAADYLALLRMFLNGGVTDSGERLLSTASVRAAVSNELGALFAVRQTTVYPPRTLDFAFLDGTQKFGFNVMIETRNRPARRPAGSYGWAGIFNTFFWVDEAAGLAAVLLMQLSPFCDPGCLETLAAFEHAVYSSTAIR